MSLLKEKIETYKNFLEALAWLDSTHHSMMQASQFVYAFEERSRFQNCLFRRNALRNLDQYQQLNKMIKKNHE